MPSASTFDDWLLGTVLIEAFAREAFGGKTRQTLRALRQDGEHLMEVADGEIAERIICREAAERGFIFLPSDFWLPPPESSISALDTPPATW